jgi:hypothetical protein
MNYKQMIAVVGLVAVSAGCGVEPESPAPSAEKTQELVPASEAAELQDESGASVTNIQGMMPYLVPGSSKLGFTQSELEELDRARAPQKPTSDEAERVHAMNFWPELLFDGQFDYKGGTWGRSYDVVVGNMCNTGYVRDYANAYKLSGGGHCGVVGWYSDDMMDCRVRVHVGVSSFSSGTCAWQVYARRVFYFDYIASNTNSAQQATTDTPVALQAGQTLTVGTCGLPGVSASGDTYLRLNGPSGQIVASNDDACSSLSSSMIYTVPPGGDGTYVIKAGCYSSGSCSGRVGYVVR